MVSHETIKRLFEIREKHLAEAERRRDELPKQIRGVLYGAWDMSNPDDVEDATKAIMALLKEWAWIGE